MTDERQPPSAEDAIIDARRAKATRRARARREPLRQRRGARGSAGARSTSPRRARSPAPRKDAAGRYDEAAVRAIAGDALLHVRGRVIALRSTGGLSFLRLRDRTGEIQLLVSEAALGATYARLAELDVGDIVEAEGALTASKRGELSIAPRAPAPAHQGATGRCPRSGTA